MTGSVGVPSIGTASRSLRATVIGMLERPFAQILLGTLLPVIVLVLQWALARTLPLKAFYIASASFGCAVSFGAMARRRQAAGVEAWLAGIRACLIVLTLPWVLFLAAVSVAAFAAWVWHGPDRWLAFALLPAMLLVALPSLSTLTVMALWSRQSWRASQMGALEGRRTLAAVGLATPLALGLAVELAARRAETIVIARYVDNASSGDPASLAAWRPLAKVHGWTALEARCGYGEPAHESAHALAQARACATLAALTGLSESSSDAARD
jgi:hypothetical protein